MCGGGGGGDRGLFYVVVINAIFFNSELNTKSFSCQTNKILEEFSSTTFVTRILSYSIL